MQGKEMMKKFIPLLILLVLYGTVAYFSYGYDDEFFNINLIESSSSYGQLISSVNGMDVHPPGSYLINKVLFDMTGDWSLVRLFAALFTAFSLWMLWRQATRPGFQSVFTFITVCLSPTILLWGTGLRWYAYAVPLINLLLYVVIQNSESKRTFWGSFFLLSVVLFHVGYISLVIVPIAFALAWYARREKRRSEYSTILWMGGVAALLCVPQLLVFLRIHLPNNSTVPPSYVNSLVGLGLHVFSGRAAYPLSVAGLALTSGNALLFGYGIVQIRNVLRNRGTQLFVFGCAGLLMARLTAKFRNLVVLSSAQGLYQSLTYSLVQNRWVKVAAFVCFSVGNGWGVVNVATHHNTTKGTWNMPYAEVLSTITREAASCHASTLITSDPGVAYYGKKLVPNLIYIIADKDWSNRVGLVQGCVIAVKTFRGSIDPKEFGKYLDFLGSRKSEIIHCGFDKNAPFKRRIDPDVPDYYADIYVMNAR
jgi:hypothetical protein